MSMECHEDISFQRTLTEGEIPPTMGIAIDFHADYIVLDSQVPNLEVLRLKIQDRVTANRGGRAQWENIEVIPDIDRVSQVAVAQEEFLRRTNGGIPVAQGEERHYKLFGDFRKDAIVSVWQGLYFQETDVTS